MVHVDSAKFGGYFCGVPISQDFFYSVWDKQNYYWPSQFHAQKQVHEMMNNYASMCTHNTHTHTKKPECMLHCKSFMKEKITNLKMLLATVLTKDSCPNHGNAAKRICEFHRGKIRIG